MNTIIQTIRVEKLACEAVIGILAHEKRARQPLHLDFEIELDASKAIASDHIEDTLDYAGLTELIKQATETSHFGLLESLHHHLLQLLSSQPGARSVRLCIHKPHALQTYGATVSVRGEWSRHE